METQQITSRLANEATDKERQKIAVINALYEIGGYGNSEQIAKATNGLTSVDVSRRTSELEKEGRLIATPIALKNSNDRLTTLYRLPHITQITLQVA